MAVQEVSDRLLTLEAPASRIAMARDHLPEIVRLVQQTGARSISISLVEAKPVPQTQPADRPADRSAEQAVPIPTDAADHPLVKEAERVFGAKVVHIEPKR